MKKQKASFIIFCILVFIIFWITTTQASSRNNNVTQYPLSPIEPTIYLQGTNNWCGPGVLQSSIQWINQYNDGQPTGTVVPIIPKATLWAFMRDHDCSFLNGRDHALYGTVGDLPTEVRKMNIAYDQGVDPHALAWTMWTYTYGQRYYHYWAYSNSTYAATVSLLYTLEKYHEPVIAAALNGSHYVLVIGYEADNLAYPNSPGTISQIRIADPLYATKTWYPYSSGDLSWGTYWFTPYTDSSDPDPSTGWYVPPPDHWKNKLVTIERDLAFDINPDYGFSNTGIIPPVFRIHIPLAVNN